MESQIKYVEASEKEIKLKVFYWRLGGIGCIGGRLFCLFSSPSSLNKCEGQTLEFTFIDSTGKVDFSGKALVETMELFPWFADTIGVIIGVLTSVEEAKIKKEVT